MPSRDRNFLMSIFTAALHFWFFIFSIGLMGLPLFIFKFSWFYFYWTLLFILGLCVKVLAHQLFNYPYIEPSGSFSGSKTDWEQYFFYGTLMALAIGATGLIFGFILSKKEGGTEFNDPKEPKIKSVIWLGCAIGIFVLFAINHLLKIYIIGVKPVYILPFYLGVPFSFLIYLGASLVLAAYVADDIANHQRFRIQIAILILVLIFLLSILTGSRAPIVIQGLPMLFGATYTQIRINKYKISYKPYLYSVIFLFMSLLTVSLFRIHYFYGESITNLHMILFYAKESVGLFIDRWTGAEALMAAVSYPNASIDTFWRLITENPSKGSGSLYQMISGSYERFELYRKEGSNLFATLPGYVGLLSLSGSYFLVFFGTCLITAFGITYELLVTKLLYQQYVCISLICASLAYYLTQVQYPEQFFVYLSNLTVFIVLIHYGLLNSKFEVLKNA